MVSMGSRPGRPGPRGRASVGLRRARSDGAPLAQHEADFSKRHPERRWRSCCSRRSCLSRRRSAAKRLRRRAERPLDHSCRRNHSRRRCSTSGVGETERPASRCAAAATSCSTPTRAAGKAGCGGFAEMACRMLLGRAMQTVVQSWREQQFSGEQVVRANSQKISRAKTAKNNSGSQTAKIASAQTWKERVACV